MIEPWDDIDPGAALDRAPHGSASIVPSSSIAGRFCVPAPLPSLSGPPRSN